MTIVRHDKQLNNNYYHGKNNYFVILLVATVFFEQVSYTVPMEDTNITLRIMVYGNLTTSITLDIVVSGFMAMAVMDTGWSDISYNYNIATKYGAWSLRVTFMTDILSDSTICSKQIKPIPSTSKLAIFSI